MEKRRTSGRHRAEPVAKRQRSASPEKKEPVVVKPKEPPIGPLKTTLPFSTADAEQLPALKRVQTAALSDKDYQSIAERFGKKVWIGLICSAVLASALQRSRSRWMGDNLFERFWSKPSKKKGQEAMKNPPKDTMVKLGICNITIEPHVLEATLYAIRDPAAPGFARSIVKPSTQLMSPIASQPFSRSPFNPTANTLQAVTPTRPIQNAAAQNSVSTPAQNGGTPSNSQTPQSLPTNPLAQSTQSTPLSSAQPSQSTPANGQPTLKHKPHPDPVIDMLAARASQDQDLRNLMKVVASRKATTKELKTFQALIDELTAAAAAKEKAKPPASQGATPITASSSSTPQRAAVTPAQTPQNQAQRPLNPAPVRPQAQFTPHFAPQMQMQQAPRPKIATPPARADVTGVCFEFNNGNGDRFLFPKYTILESLMGGTQIVASFLVTVKGSDAKSDRYNKDEEFYQPVTMRLTASHPRTLEPIFRVVASPDDTRAHMNEIMDKMTRSSIVHLAIRLPRDREHPAKEKTKDGDSDFENSEIFKTVPGTKRLGGKKADLSDHYDSHDEGKSRSRRGRVADPTKHCHICHTSNTSLWRKADIDGENVTGRCRFVGRESDKTVCNACGIKWKTNTLRAQETGIPIPLQMGPAKKRPVGRPPNNPPPDGPPGSPPVEKVILSRFGNVQKVSGYD